MSKYSMKIKNLLTRKSICCVCLYPKENLIKWDVLHELNKENEELTLKDMISGCFGYHIHNILPTQYFCEACADVIIRSYLMLQEIQRNHKLLQQWSAKTLKQFELNDNVESIIYHLNLENEINSDKEITEEEVIIICNEEKSDKSDSHDYDTHNLDEETIFECPLCFLSFNILSSYEEHYESCSKQYLDFHAQTKEEEIEDEEHESYICGMCSQSFKELTQLIKHRKKHKQVHHRPKKPSNKLPIINNNLSEVTEGNKSDLIVYRKDNKQLDHTPKSLFNKLNNSNNQPKQAKENDIELLIHKKNRKQVDHRAVIPFGTSTNVNNILKQSVENTLGLMKLTKDHMQVVHKPKRLLNQLIKANNLSKSIEENGFSHKAVCDICGILVKHKYLAIHLDTHNYQKQCQKCFKFINISSFSNHICRNRQLLKQKRSVNRQKQISCSYCLYTTKYHQLLDGHINKNHLQVRPYLCNICSKGFHCKLQLAGHMKIHSIERSNQCELCGARFPYKKSLIWHMRRHTREKPYKCLSCDMYFLSSSRRREHELTKHSDVEFKCNICNKKYGSGNSFRSHQSKCHKELDHDETILLSED